MKPTVDTYLIEGCMRCPYGATPQCKVHHWKDELITLRHIVLECGLGEEIKWGAPCYTSGEHNILMVSALKEYATISFFKGVLLSDPASILVQPGSSSQSARLIKFTSTEQIIQLKEVLQTYIGEAIAIAQAGGKVQFKQNPEPVPDELLEKFNEYPELEQAFYALTPGRQRGYIIYFSQPKQAQSRYNRIEKCIPQILNGVGLHDKYKS
jgi:uncharacterized protein YdeI (YjbR/CyaY-like superfamily)